MHRSFIITAIVIALMPGVVVSGDSSDETARQARKLADTAVITNDLLERLYGPAATGPAPVPAIAPAGYDGLSPLEQLEYAKDRRVENLRQSERAARRVALAEATLKDLEARKLAVRNPYLRRPVLTEEEAAAWEGLDNAERVRRTEAAIGRAREELEAARSELSRLRRGG